MNILIKNLPPKASEAELANLLKPYLSALGLGPEDYQIAKPLGKWWAVMRINDQQDASEFLEHYGYGQSTVIKFDYQVGKSLKFEEAQSQEEEDCKKIQADNGAVKEGGCGCSLM